MRSYHSAWIKVSGKLGEAGSSASLFPWWSFTKTILSICAFRLVEQGRLDLDSPLPSHEFTLAQLLQHTAGVPNYGALEVYHDAVASGDPPWTRERLLKVVAADRLDFAPGTGWSYSNVGYLFVRDAIERATGNNLATALEELVFSSLHVPSVRLATEPADFADVFWPHVRTYDPRWVFHGCLLGSAIDAAKVLHALFEGRILRPATLDRMLSRQPIAGTTPSRPWTACGYALGLMSGTMADAGRAIGHSGGGPGCANAIYHFPDLREPVTVAVFTNGDAEGAAEFEAQAIALRCNGECM